MRNRPRLSDILIAVIASAALFAFWGLRLKSVPSLLRIDALTAVLSASSILVIAVLLSGVARQGRGMKRACQAIGLINLLIAFWFVLVDRCHGWEFCTRCRNSRVIAETRVLSIPFRREVGAWAHPTLIESVAANLGIPCSHGSTRRSNEVRWAGLVLPQFPVFGCGPGEPRWDRSCIGEAVRSWVKADPTLAQTFQERILDHFDPTYWSDFTDRLEAACPPGQVTPLPNSR